MNVFLPSISIVLSICYISLALGELPKTGDKWNWQDIPKYEEQKDYPSREKKWSKDRDQARRTALKQFIEQLRNSEPKELKALPSAGTFPGIPKNGAPVISKKAIINPAVSGWQSTGAYALPGVPVTVKFPKAQAESGAYSIRIGSHTDKLSDKQPTWERTPELSYTSSVYGEEVTLTNPSGGLVYIVLEGGQTDDSAQPFEIEISPVVAAPMYVLGKTTPSEWRQELSQSLAPWGEIVCPRLIVTMPLEQLKQTKNIEKMAAALQLGMESQDWLAGWDKNPDRLRQPMRFVVDCQPAMGSGHSGYPAMGGYSFTTPIVTGSMLTSGAWGLWHELGHNHQQDPYRMDGLGEVTVNLFTLVAQGKITGQPVEKGWNAFSSSGFPKSMDQFFKGNGSYDDAKNEHVLRLYFFAELIREFGFEPYRQLSLKYNEDPYQGYSNQEKWDWFLVQFSEAVKKNLAPYFDSWKIKVTDAAKSKISQYPVWLPAKAPLRKYMKDTTRSK